jgi:hypothetical protein
MSFIGVGSGASRAMKRIWLVLLTAALVTAGVVFSFVSKSKDPVREHLDSIDALEMSSTGVESLQKIEEHTRALVDLGYFETRAFPLRRRVWDSAAHAQFRSLYSNASFSDSHWVLNATGESNSKTLMITARPEDMALWSNIVSRFEEGGPP